MTTFLEKKLYQKMEVVESRIFLKRKDNTWKNFVLPVQVELVPPCRKRRNEKKYRRYFKQLGGLSCLWELLL